MESQVTEATKVLISTVGAFIIALFVMPILINLAKRLSFGKQIRQDGLTPVFTSLHKKKEGTPTMGGVAIWVSVFAVAALLISLDYLLGGGKKFSFISRPQTYLPLAALFIAALLGLADDILGIFRIGPFGGGFKIRHKLITYTALGLLGAWWFYFILQKTTIDIPFGPTIDFGWIFFPVFALIIIAATFSANETDGLDGLFGGVSFFAFAAYAVIGFALHKYDLSAMSGAIVGGTLAFLWFNIHPAKIFMGDTGSMALGMTLGVMAMLTNTAILLPLFFIIPVVESLSVLVQLASKKIFKRKIFLSTPIHHHLEALGWPESQVTMRFWIVSVVFAAMGLIIFFLDRIY